MLCKSIHAVTPSRHTLPPSPFAPEEPSPPRTDAPIDLTDRIYEGDLLPVRTSPLLQDRPAHGERRSVTQHAPRELLGATKAPDPANGYQGPPANMKKPGAGMGIQPMNTLHGNSVAVGINPSYGRRRPMTYSTKGIGIQRHGGHEKYIEQNPHYKAATSPIHRASQGPPAKRRKTVDSKAKPFDTVEITDDEDEVAPLAHHETTSQPRSTLPSRSPRSTTSWQSGRSPKRLSQPVSEFQNTDERIAPKRAKPPRRKGPNGHDTGRRVSYPEVPFLGAGSLPRERSIEIYEDKSNPRSSARVSILQSLKQGGEGSSAPDVSQRADGRVTSSHFRYNNSRMRGNESIKEDAATRELDRRTEMPARESGPGNNAQEVQPPAGIRNDTIEDSEDELSRPNVLRLNHDQPSVKITQARKTALEQRLTSSKSYSLLYARSYEIEDNAANLTLEHTENRRKFRINGRDSDGNLVLLKMLDLASITTVWSDNMRNMRLTGGIKDGKRYWCDLEFAKPRDFNEFRSRYVDPEVVKQKAVPREKMEELFRHPLKKNDKVGSTPMVSEALPQSQAQSEQGRTSRSRLITEIKCTSKGPDDAPLSMPHLVARPLRSTRATASRHHQDAHEEQQVEKYSVVHGLGKAWAKPLDYSVDNGFLKRRKATLDYRDLEKLDEGEFLNDSIMTFYMLYLYDELKVSIDRVYFFNTYFFPTLTRKVKGRDGINYDDVKSWTKRDDVFSYDYIVVPINENLHWYLAIICNVSNIQRTPAVKDLQDDSQDLDQITTSIITSETAVNPDSDAKVAGQSEVGAEASAPEHVVETKEIDNDDANLFEEEKELDLIDRNAEVTDEPQQFMDQLDGPVDRTIEDTETMAALSPTDPSSIPPISASGQAKQAPKKKPKNRPGPPRKDPDKPVIMILDSLCGAHSNATRALREWLKAEGLEKRGMTVEIDNKGHYPKASQIPTQTNFSDCGLYVLGYLRKFFADPDEFRIKLLQMQMSAKSDWPDMNPSKMREDIRNLIFQLNDARNEARKEAYKAKWAGTGQHKSASPAKSTSKEGSPALKQANAPESGVSSAAPVGMGLAARPQATTLEASLPPTASHPRLGSPFAPEAKTERARSSIALGAQEVATVEKTSTAKESPVVATTTSPSKPKRSPTKRIGSPEVRVPAKSPHTNLFAYERYDNTSDLPTRPPRQSADLESPLQNHDMRARDNGKLPMLFAKKARGSSPLRHSRERQASLSPLQGRTRSGSHDDPITLDDSQDLDAPVTEPRSAKKASSKFVDLDRSQDSAQAPSRRTKRQTQSSPVVHRRSRQLGFEHDDSVREVVGGEWQESNDVRRALRQSVRDEEERRRRQSEQDSRMEEIDARVPRSQSSNSVQEVGDTLAPQPMEVVDDDDDQVIPESPLQRRSSPAVDVEMLD